MKLVECKYWQDGQCLLNRHDMPTGEECFECIRAGRNVQTGLGDTIAATINKTPIRRLKKKGCGCKRRQDKLNKVFNYGTSGNSDNKSD